MNTAPANKFKIVITDHDYGSQEIEHKILDPIADVSLYQVTNMEEILDEIGDVDGLLVEYARINRNVMERCKNLKVISRYGIGFDTVDVELATEHGIVVCNVPGYCNEEVSEHTIALILSLVRKVVFLDKTVKTKIWDVGVHKPMYALRDLTLGFVGFGNLARIVARKMKVFNVGMIATDPYVPAEFYDEYGVGKVSHDELFEQADIVVVMTALTKDSYHMVSTREFDMMKSSAVLVNTSRGAVVDESALFEALKSNSISAAAIDVVEKEPLDRDSGLLTLDNIIITPHASFYSVGSIIELQTRAVQAVKDVLEGRKPRDVVNVEVLEKLNLKS
jgi:D-3-phosphoglycerate dehydrogenase